MAIRTTTIAINTSLSAAFATDGRPVTGISVPLSSGWDTANLTFQVSVDGGATYYDLWVNGIEHVVTIPTGRTAATFHPTEYPMAFAGATHVKVRSGTVGTPVVQTAARTLQYGLMD